MDEVIVYTDGGCSGNPGPGGWAFVIVSPQGDIISSSSGGEIETTNNKMELSAVINALDSCSAIGCSKVAVFTDSQYVKNGISSWINSWKKNGWRTASRDPVKNKDLWIRLDKAASELNVSWNWVKGHAGIKFNEMCDSLVRRETERVRR